MLIESNNLMTVTNFSKEKGLSRQHVYRLIKSGEINSIDIDGVVFVILDEKSQNFTRKRSKSE